MKIGDIGIIIPDGYYTYWCTGEKVICLKKLGLHGDFWMLEQGCPQWLPLKCVRKIEVENV